jgi:hypothetical protein
MNDKQQLVSAALTKLGFVSDAKTTTEEPKFGITSDILTLLQEATGKFILVNPDGVVRIE